MSSTYLRIQQAKLDDLPEILSLFVASINQTCIQDYTPQQLEVWSAGAQRIDRWKKRLNEHIFLTGKIQQTLVGFVSLQDGHYLDVLYVHPHFQRQGVAQQLTQSIIHEAIKQQKTKISVDASITALPFFKRIGFQMIRKNEFKVEGVTITNYYMELVL